MIGIIPFTLVASMSQMLRLPVGSAILKVEQCARDLFTLHGWALGDEKAPLEEREIVSYSSRDLLPDPEDWVYSYLGTYYGISNAPVMPLPEPMEKLDCKACACPIYHLFERTPILKQEEEGE